MILLILIYGTSLKAQINLKSIECALAFRIMHFTEIVSQSGNYNFCIDGDNDVYNLFKHQLQDQKFKEGKIRIIRISQNKYKDCSLIYLGDNSSLDNKSITRAIEKSKVLVFSSRDDKRKVSLIHFDQHNNKVEFRVNKTLLDLYKINISSKVLRLASEVY